MVFESYNYLEALRDLNSTVAQSLMSKLRRGRPTALFIQSERRYKNLGAHLNPVAKDSFPIYNIPMDFGPVQPELLPGARNAIETCLAVQSGERVALIFDRASEAVAASLDQALKNRAAIIEAFCLEDLAQRPLTKAPQPLIDALNRADAGILCM